MARGRNSIWSLSHSPSELSGGNWINEKGKLLSIIGDEDTCVGFLLGGIGEINSSRQPNFMVVEKKTTVSEIEECFKKFTQRDDIAIILINQNIAELIRNTIDAYKSAIPTVLEIPSKEHPYDENKDTILRRAKLMVKPEGGEGGDVRSFTDER